MDRIRPIVDDLRSLFCHIRPLSCIGKNTTSTTATTLKYPTTTTSGPCSPIHDLPTLIITCDSMSIEDDENDGLSSSDIVQYPLQPRVSNYLLFTIYKKIPKISLLFNKIFWKFIKQNFLKIISEKVTNIEILY